MDGRPPGPYNPAMPILEALMGLSYMAAVTSRVTLGTEVLVLPQREPTLVAKQVSTLDTLSGGRVRLGIGVGWQESSTRPWARTSTRAARAWTRPSRSCAHTGATRRSNTSGKHYRVHAMAMEPKPPQGRRLPVWIGGYSEAAFRRVGRLGDGWLASRVTDAEDAKRALESIRRHAEAAGRDPASIGLQSMVAPPPRDAESKRFYAEPDRVVARAAALQSMGFQWVSLNATAMFQAGARSVDAMIEGLELLHGRLRAEVS